MAILPTKFGKLRQNLVQFQSPKTVSKSGFGQIHVNMVQNGLKKSIGRARERPRRLSRAARPLPSSLGLPGSGGQRPRAPAFATRAASMRARFAGSRAFRPECETEVVAAVVGFSVFARLARASLFGFICEGDHFGLSSRCSLWGHNDSSSFSFHRIRL